jgi:DNA repair exonuclease SbcCD ATPase subunit
MSDKVIRLKSLQLRAFRSYIEEVVEFPPTGMMLLRGANLDTKGGSGSGKSTIVEALNFGLDFASFPSTELQSWLTEKPLQVTLELQTPGGDVCVTRGDKPRFSAEGQKTLTGATAVAAALDQALGINAKLLKSLTCRSQRKAGMFLSLTDAEKKEFLTPILGVEPFEKAVDDAGRRISEIQKKLVPAQAALDAVNAEAWKEVVVEEDLAPLRDEILAQEKRVAWTWKAVTNIEAEEARWKEKHGEDHLAEQEAIRAKIKELMNAPPPEDIQAQIDILRGDLSEAHQRLDHALGQEVEGERQRLQDIKFATSEVNKLETSHRAVQIYRERLRVNQTELAALESSTCPTCAQAWIGEDALASREAIKATIETYLKDIAAYEAEHSDYEAELQALIERTEKLSASIDRSMSNRLTQAAGFIHSQITGLEYKVGVDRALAVAALKAQLHVSVEEASPFTERWKAALDHHSEMEVQLAVKKSELGAAEARMAAYSRVVDREKGARLVVEDLELALKREQDFQDMLKDFLAAVFDEALAEISDETNHILAGVPNTANVTLQFRSETLTQKGTAKKSIVPVMTVNGHEAKLGSGCSGGMISSVELATDLAVRSVLSRRLGVRPGWIVLDEPFEGLGPVEKEGYLEIIREYANTNLVIVVDHSSEFKEFFTQVVDIEYANGVSKVTNVSHDN